MQYEHERETQPYGKRHGGKLAPRYAAELVAAVEAREGCLFIADVGATPVGFIAAYRMNDPDPALEEDSRSHGYVRDLYVLPNWRRMGVGSRLLGAAEGHFRSLGVGHLRLAGAAQNSAMGALCQSIGCAPYTIVYERVISPLFQKKEI